MPRPPPRQSNHRSIGYESALSLANFLLPKKSPLPPKPQACSNIVFGARSKPRPPPPPQPPGRHFFNEESDVPSAAIPARTASDAMNPWKGRMLESAIDFELGSGKPSHRIARSNPCGRALNYESAPLERARPASPTARSPACTFNFSGNFAGAVYGGGAGLPLHRAADPSSVGRGRVLNYESEEAAPRRRIVEASKLLLSNVCFGPDSCGSAKVPRKHFPHSQYFGHSTWKTCS